MEHSSDARRTGKQSTARRATNMVYVWSLSVPSWAKVESQTVGVREKSEGEGSVETIPKAFLKLEHDLK